MESLFLVDVNNDDKRMKRKDLGHKKQISLLPLAEINNTFSKLKIKFEIIYAGFSM